MLKIAVFCAIVIAAQASYLGAPGAGYGAAYGKPGAGYDYSPKPYSFGYDVVGGGGAHSRRETADGSGRVKGSYSLGVVDGRKRVVNYVADDYGFRAEVNTNEAGTDSKDPADVKVTSTAGAGVKGAYSHGYAGVVAAPSYGAASYGGRGLGGLGYGRLGAGYAGGYGGLGAGGYGGLGAGGYAGGYGGLGAGGYAGGYGGGYGGHAGGLGGLGAGHAGLAGVGLGSGGYSRSYSKSYDSRTTGGRGRYH